MAGQRATTERLGSFSDGMFTIAITIMVFQLKVALIFRSRFLQAALQRFNVSKKVL